MKNKQTQYVQCIYYATVDVLLFQIVNPHGVGRDIASTDGNNPT